MDINYQTKKIQSYFFLVFFSLIPISILFGPTVSLINILLIDFLFLYLIIAEKNYKFLINKDLFYIIVLFIYLIFNTIISLEPELSFKRNLGFLRIVLIFLSFNFFFSKKYFLEKILNVWTIIFVVVVFDIYLEFIFGKNLLGYNGGFYKDRIVSFFKDEPIVGSFINGFFFLILGYLFSNSISIPKKIIIFFSIVVLLSIFLTGERSSSIKATLGLIIFLTVIMKSNFKSKLLFFILISTVFLTIIFNSANLKYRFINQIKNISINDNIYFKIYKSGYEVFKEFPYFGTGNKNYRYETCQKPQKNDNYVCQTHPHQVYLEFLSEHGIFGTVIIFFIFYKIIFSKIFNILQTKNSIQIGCLIYMCLVFLPLIPSGAFFSDYSLTIFAINLSLFYAVDKELNVFKPS